MTLQFAEKFWGDEETIVPQQQNVGKHVEYDHFEYRGQIGTLLAEGTEQDEASEVHGPGQWPVLQIRLRSSVATTQTMCTRCMHAVREGMVRDW